MGLLSDAAGGRFAPVTVTTPRSSAGVEPATAFASAIEVRLRNGRILRAPEGIAPARVAQFAEALERSAE